MGTVHSSLLKKGVKSAMKFGIKMGLNAFFPGSGVIVEIVEALICFYNGDYQDGIMIMLFAVIDLDTLGMSAAAKSTAEAAGKKILIQNAREHKAQYSNRIGRAISKMIATGFDKDLAVNYAKTQTKQFGKMLGRNLGKDLRNGSIGLTVEETFLNVTKTNVGSIFRETVFAGIGSEGQNIMEEMFLGSVEEAFNFITLIARDMPMPVFTSVGEAAVKKMAMESARSMQREAVIIGAIKAVTKGIVKYLQEVFERMPDITNQKILDAWILTKLPEFP